VGLGDFVKKEFKAFGEFADPPTRGEMLDEAIEIVTGLQSGERFSFSGSHYRFDETRFNPRPIQRPRVPVWVAGQWPNKPPFRRAAKWDGVVPLAKGRPKDKFLTSAEVREIDQYIGRYRSSTDPFDICLSGRLPGNSKAEDRAILASYKEVGVTWWIEFIYSGSRSLKKNAERIAAGPVGH
jgi:alkanesulfonate monooxygenase SsuD/methylene tetrahydromethanopterin reductase-like flavin-dependent oxidoreductase (luciferase family)